MKTLETLFLRLTLIAGQFATLRMAHVAAILTAPKGTEARTILIMTNGSAVFVVQPISEIKGFILEECAASLKTLGLIEVRVRGNGTGFINGNHITSIQPDIEDDPQSHGCTIVGIDAHNDAEDCDHRTLVISKPSTYVMEDRWTFSLSQKPIDHLDPANVPAKDPRIIGGEPNAATAQQVFDQVASLIVNGEPVAPMPNGISKEEGAATPRKVEGTGKPNDPYRWFANPKPEIKGADLSVAWIDEAEDVPKLVEKMDAWVEGGALSEATHENYAKALAVISERSGISINDLTLALQSMDWSKSRYVKTNKDNTPRRKKAPKSKDELARKYIQNTDMQIYLTGKFAEFYRFKVKCRKFPERYRCVEYNLEHRTLKYKGGRLGANTPIARHAIGLLVGDEMKRLSDQVKPKDDLAREFIKEHNVHLQKFRIPTSSCPSYKFKIVSYCGARWVEYTKDGKWVYLSGELGLDGTSIARHAIRLVLSDAVKRNEAITSPIGN